MTDIAIKCDGLSKQYRIGERESYKALRDVITDAATAPFRRVRSAMRNANGSQVRTPKSEIRNSFWALDDVSFEVKRGEVVGIIGRNGAGKSTLLKILSRITKPTRGHARIHGRVGSLLEVGTGFHPELTGRENIYLNAAILGMRKAEVAKRFDEIVAFAEVEKFIDTPVKRYSSGMYVRLAFAVAAHLEPEILVIDEVLAVGDAAFQKKCLGKIGEVAHGGRTVLFVSHNMEAILRLCDRAVLLEGGAIATHGETAEVVGAYLRTGASQLEIVDLTEAMRGISVRGQALLTAVRMDPLKPHGSWRLPFGEEISFEVEIEAKAKVHQIELGVALNSGRGFEIASCFSSQSLVRSALEPGRYKYSVKYPALRLVPGAYSFGLGLRSDAGFEDYIADAFTIEVVPSELSASFGADSFRGAIVPEARFRLVPIASSLPQTCLT
ncbi:MAG TPA: ABC transporter ATP-binding protein [Pyrinomonadaceae bacterium]|nr:ABC transporter ATP-binding protein [Pyrinomonadaceae bacterium]